jgi:hypothetical protein
MSIVKRGLHAALRPAISRASALIRNSSPHVDFDSICQQVQRSLITQYTFCRSQKIAPYSNIRDAGFRVYSQFEEDGIILYVLAMIGFETRRVVEICCGNGKECMAANLIVNHGFEGILLDGDDGNVATARDFFTSKKDCLIRPPIILKAWVAADNVNALLASIGCTGDVDLLSIDLDGNDYWILKAIEVISPRLLVVETHNIIPGDLSVTIPYRPDFDYRKSAVEDFRSASLLAMVNLCRNRGYRLIGAHRHGFNAFFLRNELGLECFPEVSIASVHDNAFTHWSQRTRWPAVKELPWVEV